MNLSGTIEIKLHGFLDEESIAVRDIFQRLTSVFGPASYTRELVIFFKYRADMRLRVTDTQTQFILRTEADSGRRDLSRVFVVPIPLHDTESFVRQLNALGYREGLFSHSDQYTFSNARGNFRLKMNSICGHFYDTGKTLEADETPDRVRAHLSAILKEVGLESWSDEAFFSRTEKYWQGVPQEPLILESGALNSKIQDILIRYAYATSVPDTGTTLKSILNRTSNDYSDAERAFKVMTSWDLVSNEPLIYRNTFLISGSIIIPVHKHGHSTLPYTLESIVKQDLTDDQRTKLEVIIVDDGTGDVTLDAVLTNYLQNLQSAGFNARIIRLYQRVGRAQARNVGLQVATGDVVCFVDSDVILERGYIRECMVRHQFVDKLVVLGLKQNIGLTDPCIKLGHLESLDRPDTSHDFRMERDCSPDWRGLYPVKRGITVRCLDETRNLKDFGLGRVLGPFDLPCMVVTHSMSASREELLSIRGFDAVFGTKWGLEDTYLGARLIARKNFVLPLLSSGVYHLDMPSETGPENRMEKYAEMAENYAHYLRLLNQDVRFY